MTSSRPKILFAFNEFVYSHYLPSEEVQRLESFADWEWLPCQGGDAYEANHDPGLAETLRRQVATCDGLVICHGAPLVSAEIMEAAPNLRFIGDLESDRFARRVDLDAAWARRIRTVDTTNGSSYPVAEWALGLILLCMHNGGAHFRRMIQGHTQADQALVRASPGMLARKRVGLIGGGHMGRRLLKLLRPFEVEAWVHDPYLAHDMAEALGLLQTSLDHLLAQCDVVVCMAPLTPATQGHARRA
jgi:D-3-phosphoglycerate dehydrogenase